MIECKYCRQPCCKKGVRKNGAQRYQCTGCRKYSQAVYCYKGCENSVSDNIVRLNNEGMGIRSIARFLKMSHTTVIKRIRALSKKINFPVFTEEKQEYEMDELWTYCGNKDNELYISYAINRHSRQPVDFIIGGRTKENLEKLVSKILALNPVKIYTDGLNIYPMLIPHSIHKAGKCFTNRMERYNLTLRTHLKRLIRSTISFSKKIDMLEACLRLYFYNALRIERKTKKI